MKSNQSKFFIFLLVLLSVHVNATWVLPPSDLSDPGEHALSSRVCFNNTGTAFIIWRRAEGVNTIVQASIFDGSSFSKAQNLSESGKNVFSSQVCCNNAGNAIVIWSINELANTIIQVSHYDNRTSSWSSPSTISTSTGGISAPDICCDNFGNAFAIWNAGSGASQVIQISRYDGITWSAPESISANGQVANAPQICCDNNGNAFAIWQEYNGTNTLIVSSYFNGSSWSPFEPLSLPGSNHANPQICCNDNGNAIAIWSQETDNFIQSSQFIDSKWNFLGNVSDATQTNTFGPKICCNSDGNAFATWQASNGTNNVIQSSIFDGSIWSPNTQLSFSGQNALAGNICCDEFGNAIAVWSGSISVQSIIRTSFFNGTFWSNPFDLSEAGGNANGASISCDFMGNAVASWDRSEGINRIIQATFNLSSPKNLSGFLRINRFASQSTITTLLRWDRFPPSLVANYKIYRNGILIATIPGTQNVYRDCTINFCQTYSYSIIAVGQNGEESESQTIIL